MLIYLFSSFSEHDYGISYDTFSGSNKDHLQRLMVQEHVRWDKVTALTHSEINTFISYCRLRVNTIGFPVRDSFSSGWCNSPSCTHAHTNTHIHTHTVSPVTVLHSVGTSLQKSSESIRWTQADSQHTVTQQQQQNNNRRNLEYLASATDVKIPEFCYIL